jgi:hypothetical protein
MEHLYRIVAVQESELASHSDFAIPKAVYSVIPLNNGPTVRLKLPRRGDWRPGDVVRIQEAIVLANVVQ